MPIIPTRILIRNKKTHVPALQNNTSKINQTCRNIILHWNGERFIPSEAHLLVQFKVIPIHNGQLKYFQKITRPDTITEASLHKVWYSKSNNQVEFFTADGENPEDNQLLRQLSIHMYNQYIKNY